MMTSGNSSWSKLLPELLIEIAKKIKGIEDFDAFHRVCASWRAAATKKDFTRTIPNVPLLMLQEEEDSDDREFFSLTKGKIWKRMSLPEAKGKTLLESRGWFVTVDKRDNKSLVHPFSHVQIPLPKYSKVSEAQDHDGAKAQFIFLEQSVVLSANPLETPDYVIWLVHSLNLCLAFWRPGQETWTEIHVGTFFDWFDAVNYFNGQFYALKHSGQVWALNISDSTRVQVSMVFQVSFELLVNRRGYLVELSGKLILITRNGIGIGTNPPVAKGDTKFHIFELNLIKGYCVEIKSLGDVAVFVGRNSAFSVDASSFPGINPNGIYFTDDVNQCLEINAGGSDMGIYHVQDGKIERFDDVGQSFRFNNNIAQPLWITPYF